MDEKTRQRIEDHNKLLRLYAIAENYKVIALTIGRLDRAEEIDKLLRDISRNHVLDRVLKGGE